MRSAYLALAAIVLAACGDDAPDDTDTDTDTIVDTSPPVDTGETGADTGPVDTGPVDTGDTGDSGDTGPVDTGDTGPVDTGDTGPADTGDTGDTGPVDTGDTGEPALVPEIVTFTVDPPGLPIGGGPVTLSWEVTGAETLTIEGIGEVTGDSVTVDVDETTPFTLTATNDAGTAVAETTIIVAVDAPPPVVLEPVSSVDLIEEALEDGVIDEVTALRYEVFAVFDDPRLPAAYDVDAPVHGTPVMKDLAVRFPTLPPDVQDELRPFMLSPDDPDSWFHLEGRRGLRQAGVFDAHFEVEVPQGEIWVWYDTSALTAEEVEYVEVVVGRSANTGWRELTGLMGRTPIQHIDFPGPDTDDAYHLYVVDESPTGSLGHTTYGDFDSDAGGYESHVVIFFEDIQDSIGSSTPFYAAHNMAATVVHELMHGIQFAFDMVEIDGEREDWLSESTATWTEHYVYPSFQTEQVYAEDFIDVPFLRLTSTGGLHEYGGYLFHFYVQDAVGADAVRRMYEASESQEVLEAVDTALGGDLMFHWEQFTAQNWNAEPVDFYWQRDSLSDAVAFVTDFDTIEVVGGRDVQLMELVTSTALGPALGVDALSAQYFHYDLTDPGVHSVLFANGYTFELKEGLPQDEHPMTFSLDRTYYAEELTDDERDGATVYALVKQAGAWHPVPFDLTDVAFASFCNDYTEESVEELVLIFANSRFESGDRVPIAPKGIAPSLFTTNVACGDWAGFGSVEVRRFDLFGSEVTDVFMNDLTFTRERRELTRLMSGAAQRQQGQVFLPSDGVSDILFGSRYALESADVTWSTDRASSFGTFDCQSSGSGTFDADDAQAVLFEYAPLASGSSGQVPSLYRSWFLELFFLDQGPAVTGSCTDGTSIQEPFGTALAGGFRNTELGPFVISEDGLFMEKTWSSDDGDVAFEIGLVGLSD